MSLTKLMKEHTSGKCGNIRYGIFHSCFLNRGSSKIGNIEYIYYDKRVVKPGIPGVFIAPII